MPPLEVDQPAPRLLPVVILADTSGSMTVHGKLAVLNDALVHMLGSFRQLDVPGCTVAVSVISFGGSARIHTPMTPVHDLAWAPLSAAGNTPLGAALRLAHDLLEDSTVAPRRSYRPNLVLVSDGIPTDDWADGLKQLNSSAHAARASRFAVGVGPDRKVDVLKRFTEDDDRVVEADQVTILTEFFEYVTFAVTTTVTATAGVTADIPTFADRDPAQIPTFRSVPGPPVEF